MFKDNAHKCTMTPISLVACNERFMLMMLQKKVFKFYFIDIIVFSKSNAGHNWHIYEFIYTAQKAMNHHKSFCFSIFIFLGNVMFISSPKVFPHSLLLSSPHCHDWLMDYNKNHTRVRPTVLVFKEHIYGIYLWQPIKCLCRNCMVQSDRLNENITSSITIFWLNSRVMVIAASCCNAHL
mgnify:CR=1 FL=1